MTKRTLIGTPEQIAAGCRCGRRADGVRFFMNGCVAHYDDFMRALARGHESALQAEARRRGRAPEARRAMTIRVRPEELRDHYECVGCHEAHASVVLTATPAKMFGSMHVRISLCETCAVDLAEGLVDAATASQTQQHSDEVPDDSECPAASVRELFTREPAPPDDLTFLLKRSAQLEDEKRRGKR